MSLRCIGCNSNHNLAIHTVFDPSQHSALGCFLGREVGPLYDIKDHGRYCVAQSTQKFRFLTDSMKVLGAAIKEGKLHRAKDCTLCLRNRNFPSEYNCIVQTKIPKPCYGENLEAAKHQEEVKSNWYRDRFFYIFFSRDRSET